MLIPSYKPSANAIKHGVEITFMDGEYYATRLVIITEECNGLDILREAAEIAVDQICASLNKAQEFILVNPSNGDQKTFNISTIDSGDLFDMIVRLEIAAVEFEDKIIEPDEDDDG